MDNKGIWVKYDSSNKEDIINLRNSLKNSNIKYKYSYEHGEYIDHVDTYVYYTLMNNTYSLPRILFKVENRERIPVIKGIGINEEVEVTLCEELKNKINELKNINLEDKYKIFKYIYEIQMIDVLVNKIKNHQDLDYVDIKNLYIDCDFYGYNKKLDPRINTIKKSRAIVKDYYSLKNNEEKKIFLYKNINFLPYDFIQEKEVILSAIKDKPFVLQYASRALKRDKNFIFECVKLNPDSFEYADCTLKKNITYISVLIKVNSKVAKYISKTILSNKRIMLSLLKIDSFVMRYVDPKLYDDIEFMREAIKINRELARFAGKELLKDKEIAKSYMNYNKKTNWLNEDLRQDKDFILNSIVESPSLILNIDESLRTKEFLIECIKRNINVIFFLNKELEDKDFGAEIIKINPYVLYHLFRYFKDDKEYINKLITTLNEMKTTNSELEEFKKDSIKTLKFKMDK